MLVDKVKEKMQKRIQVQNEKNRMPIMKLGKKD